MVYSDALVILKGYEKINWLKPPQWARAEAWIECDSSPVCESKAPPEEATEALTEREQCDSDQLPPPVIEPGNQKPPEEKPKRKRKRKKAASKDNPWKNDSGGWL